MKYKLITTALFAAFAFPALAQEPDSVPKAQEQANKREEMLQRFDTNHDGQLDPAERKAAKEARAQGQMGQKGGPPERAKIEEQRRRKMLERFDVNKDGKLDEAEKQAAKEVRQKAEATKKNGAPNARGPKPGADGPRGKRREAIRKRFDANGDGQLSDAERAKAKRAVSRMRRGPADPRGNARRGAPQADRNPRDQGPMRRSNRAPMRVRMRGEDMGRGQKMDRGGRRNVERRGRSFQSQRQAAPLARRNMPMQRQSMGRNQMGQGQRGKMTPMGRDSMRNQTRDLRMRGNMQRKPAEVQTFGARRQRFSKAPNQGRYFQRGQRMESTRMRGMEAQGRFYRGNPRDRRANVRMQRQDDRGSRAMELRRRLRDRQQEF